MGERRESREVRVSIDQMSHKATPESTPPFVPLGNRTSDNEGSDTDSLRT